MSATLLGALATAGALGVTHALEPDHVAGISSVTGRYANPRLSALVGACFSAGHVALVVVWLVLSSLVLERTGYPAILDTIGTLVVGLALGALGAVLSVQGFRAAARAHRTDHHDDHDATPHLHLPFVGHHGHHHGTRTYLKTGLVGALFTLSPPLSMIAFLGTVLPSLGLPAAGLAVLAYAVGITVTMATVGAGVGSAFGLAGGDERVAGLLRLAAGLVVIAFAVAVVLGAL
jgi:hypothetical protein